MLASNEGRQKAVQRIQAPAPTVQVIGKDQVVAVAHQKEAGYREDYASCAGQASVGRIDDP